MFRDVKLYSLLKKEFTTSPMAVQSRVAEKSQAGDDRGILPFKEAKSGVATRSERLKIGTGRTSYLKKL